MNNDFNHDWKDNYLTMTNTLFTNNKLTLDHEQLFLLIWHIQLINDINNEYNFIYILDSELVKYDVFFMSFDFRY